MIHRKSIRELSNILTSFETRLASYDKDAERNREGDYALLPSSKLNFVLRSGIPTEEKKKLLLSQIGLVRINLFTEHYARIQKLEESKQLDEAVKVMNDYVRNVALPFIPRKKRPSLWNRLLDLISLERVLEPFEYTQEWEKEYQAWFEQKEGLKLSYIEERERQEKFAHLRTIFHMLYALSFSDDNFPPSPIIVIMGKA